MGTRVFIGRLSNSARERDVERFFKGYGKIMEIVLKTGFGFVVSILILSELATVFAMTFVSATVLCVILSN